LLTEAAVAAIKSGEESINQRTLQLASYARPTERRRLFERERRDGTCDEMAASSSARSAGIAVLVDGQAGCPVWRDGKDLLGPHNLEFGDLNVAFNLVIDPPEVVLTALAERTGADLDQLRTMAMTGAVTNASAGRGIAVASTRRPYGWEFELTLAPAASARDRLEISLRDGVVSERCRSWSWCAAAVLAAAAEEPPDGPRPDLRGDDSDGISDHFQRRVGARLYAGGGSREGHLREARDRGDEGRRRLPLQ
jgi:hypothetical protein